MSEEERKGFEAEVNSGFEPILIARIFEPTLKYIPFGMAPNTISILGHLCCWATFGLAYLSTTLSLGPLKAMALVGAGVMTFFTMAADCFDGMQARRTGRTSKLGEMLDHWLDAIHVPMTSAGLLIVLGFDPWLAAVFHVSATTIYNAQLVLYNKTGRFIHTPTSGVDAQFITSISYLMIAVYLGIVGSNYWVNLGIGVVASLTQIRLNVFYYVRLKAAIGHHLLFVALALAYGAYYVLGLMSPLTFALLIVFLSFRVTGRWVAASLLDRRYSGLDLSALLFAVAIPVGAYLLEPLLVWGGDLWAHIPHLAAGCFVLLNLAGFIRDYHRLAPQS